MITPRPKCDWGSELEGHLRVKRPSSPSSLPHPFSFLSAFDPMSSPLTTLKRTLRKSVQRTLKSLPPSAVSEQCSFPSRLLDSFPLLPPFLLADSVSSSSTLAATGLLQYLLSSPIYTSSRSLSVYLSMPHSEIQTLPIISDALSKGKRVFVPFIPKGGHMSMVRVYEGEDLDSNRDNWGIPVVRLEREDGTKREDGELESFLPSLPLVELELISPSTSFLQRTLSSTDPLLLTLSYALVSLSRHCLSIKIGRWPTGAHSLPPLFPQASPSLPLPLLTSSLVWDTGRATTIATSPPTELSLSRKESKDPSLVGLISFSSFGLKLDSDLSRSLFFLSWSRSSGTVASRSWICNYWRVRRWHRRGLDGSCCDEEVKGSCHLVSFFSDASSTSLR